MEHRNAELAALIGSRICHDLISPIGAIANGLELLEITGAARGPEMDLIADSADNAGARIRFFRIAFGAAGDQELGRGEILSILDGLNQGGRVRIDWSVPGPRRRDAVRLAFLAILCCETALTHGGHVEVSVSDDIWRIAGSADRLTADPALWSRIGAAGAPGDLTPAQVQFALLPVVAGEMGRTPRATIDANSLRIEV